MKAMTANDKQPWEPMKLADVGHVGEVLQLGGGKVTGTLQPDHGQEVPNKPPGQG